MIGLKKVTKFFHHRKWAFKTLIFLLVTLFITISSLTIFAYNPPWKKQKTLSFANKADQQKYGRFLNYIEELGGQEAYQVFGSETAKLNLNQQHKDAHLFGEALYQVEGVNGVAVCDTQFNYGCYHSFLGSAIYAEGLDIIPTLYSKCAKNLEKDSSSCPHGIGHGILSSIGYDFDSLRKTLDICDKLGVKDPVKGCFNGAFMEYHFQTMLLDAGNTRPYDQKNPYFPCYDIGPQFRNSCMFQQSQWWLGAIKADVPDRVKEIDSLCSKLPQSHRNQCYKGLGVQILSYNKYDVDEAKLFCDSLNGKDAKLTCRAGVYMRLLAIPKLQNRANEFCNDPSLTPEEKHFCTLQTDQMFILSNTN